jgi:ABC-type spermidine/putrescine transport system permease subunit II
MDMQNSFAPSHGQQPLAAEKRSLVPRGITIGLAVLSLVLSLAGYAFRLIAGHEVAEVMLHASMLVPAFVIGIPVLFWIGSRIFNKIQGTHIEVWNAISLGYLTSCISLLWLMGTYS